MDSDSVGRLRKRQPLFWPNPNRRPVAACRDVLDRHAAGVVAARARFARFAPLLADLFPELASTGGVIGSALTPIPGLAGMVRDPDGSPVVAPGSLFLKADHALPVAGSVKARGGVHAVLRVAERLALAAGLLDAPDDDHRALGEPAAREFFARHRISVGSTGNLGLSIGVMGRALGFAVDVHMSREARAWKKARLKRVGARVVEHAGDYSAACAVARAEASGRTDTHFIDDENSLDLFYGYAVAAGELAGQLAAAGIDISQERPLFLYLPCGVGGAPGGIALGARLGFGDAARIFFVEPVMAPCLLWGMASGRHEGADVAELGLTLATEADGLAVGRPSRFVGRLMEPLLDGCLTVSDMGLFRYLAALHAAHGIEVEPSAAAGPAGMEVLFADPAGWEFVRKRGGDPAAHVVWATGGRLVPAKEHAAYRAGAARMAREKGEG
ncbi:D-serine ammonia-lyase [Desulfolutivibrio sulfoxidireducens]|uniref:D-serine ammonia-lyase n=1 Tax=Desulfolutivibrio sulfoxidireducens TaxID=2773299 RepID=UPI00159D2F8A|nr:D-serine ammonia-lyase [Desulfolutivibrio sulfoxidireducens]QLA20275.1 D-serine ammonia-lyase [Desulfolutivibrio sulfoxidireducens]